MDPGVRADYNARLKFFDNWGRPVLTGQGRLAVARRGARKFLVKKRAKN
jgi:hypothetical protein